MSDQPSDLAACDVEPIHVPESIQPNGVLIALREADLTVVAVSANTDEMLGVPSGRAIGMPLAHLVGPDVVAEVARALRAEELSFENPLRLTARNRSFEGVLHRNGAATILELEPAPDESPRLDRVLRDIIIRLQRAKTVDELCVVAAEQFRALTGFDRVMVYRFHSDGHGEVVAEDRTRDLEPFLGLHYPASDIPRQARQLYLLNPLRSIPDARYTPVPLLHSASSPAPLDLTFAALRAVSPVHVEYLANMGVRASMSVSLIRGEQLWGLLACHHREPRQLPFAVRSACEIVSRLVSLQLDALEETGMRAQRDALRGDESVLVEAMRGAHDGWAAGLLQRPEALLRLVNATGAAVCTVDGIRAAGIAPSSAEIAAIAAWLASAPGGIFVTAALGREFPPARAFQSVASGLLAVRVPNPGPAYIMWFRHEVLQTVTWSGDPAKPIAPVQDDVRLHPRRSFALFKELVRGTARPWAPAVLELARSVARLAVEVDLEQQITRAEKAIRARDDIVAVVSHDLKNPVNVIRLAVALVRRQVVDAEPIASLDRIDRAAHRMTVLITNLLDLAKIEAGRFQVEPKPCRARDLVTEVIALHGPIAEQRDARLDGAAVEDVQIVVDHDRAFQVLSNLVSNAIKFAPPGGTVSIATLTDSGFTRFAVHDDGPGIAPTMAPHIFERYWQGPASRWREGSGLGLYIAKGLVEAHGGRIWVESTAGAGSTFYFTVPSFPAA